MLHTGERNKKQTAVNRSGECPRDHASSTSCLPRLIDYSSTSVSVGKRREVPPAPRIISLPPRLGRSAIAVDLISSLSKSTRNYHLRLPTHYPPPMPDPPKPAEPSAKAADDFVTKYKVRPTSGDANPPRRRRSRKIIDFIVDPFWSFRAIAVL